MSEQNKMGRLVMMGKIAAPYGVLGWVKVLPDTEALDGLLQYATWQIGRGDEWQDYVPVNAKIHNDVLLVKLRGVDDRDAAFALKGKLVAVPREALPMPGKDEYYWSDLIGLGVKNLQEIDFGEVTDVFETGANDVLVVTDKATKQERLIPFIGQVVLNVDLDAKQIQVDWDATF
ncbi:MAG TPA: ribosome maturation factor RimM [Methylophilus sp.]|nr:ribosome maturation factor RimM [Methylophilus sp.]HQQ33895.1 ribosome maturation factor RimM [Methylophilus sp.]